MSLVPHRFVDKLQGLCRGTNYRSPQYMYPRRKKGKGCSDRATMKFRHHPAQRLPNLQPSELFEPAHHRTYTDNIITSAEPATCGSYAAERRNHSANEVGAAEIGYPETEPHQVQLRSVSVSHLQKESWRLAGRKGIDWERKNHTLAWISWWRCEGSSATLWNRRQWL